MKPSDQDTPQIPAALVEVALITSKTAAAASGVSLSHWHDLVRTGRAPMPVIREPRFTRWRLGDVRRWLVDRADRGSEAATADAVVQRARNASAIAQVGRKKVAL